MVEKSGMGLTKSGDGAEQYLAAANAVNQSFQRRLFEVGGHDVLRLGGNA
jgi:hypothetical protein